MKKKILIAALIVSMIAIMVGTSLAYFTAQDEVENTFTVGSVKIEIYENDTATGNDTFPITEPLVPVVKMDDAANDPGYIEKSVEVMNTGLNDAYIRTHIAIPTNLVGYLYLDLAKSGWTRQQPDSTATVEGVDYTVFTYDHTEAVTAGNFTAELLKGVYLGSNVDLEEDASGNLVFILRNADGTISNSNFVAHNSDGNGGYTSATVSILVASEAIQAQGFSDATTALDSGFPAANPWTAVAP